MQQQWGLESDESKRVEQLRADVVKKAHDELHQFNQHKRAQLSQYVKDEKEGDMSRLNAVLDRERTEDEKEARCRAAQADLTRSFAAHMMAQKVALAGHEAEQEAIRAVQMGKAWDKRLAEWGAEQSARENLMAQVLEERKQQVQVKLQACHVDKQNQAVARQRLEAELSAVNSLEKSKLDEAQSIRMTHRALLENQIKEIGRAHV